MKLIWWPHGRSLPGRSLTAAAQFLQVLHAKAVDDVHQQGLAHVHAFRPRDVSDAGVFAEFERAMIRERVMAGLARAKAEERG